MKRCPRYPLKRRYARWEAVEDALSMTRQGETDLRVFHCTCCHGWHVGHRWAHINLQERQARRRPMKEVISLKE